jgi:hypothetical protein
VGDGKSGMLFFFSKNRNYVIKTLKKSELKPMIELLPDYFAHMREYPDSLLCRFLALFTLSIFRQVKTPEAGEAPTFGATPNQSYFLLVMSSAFLSPYTPDVVYDLKGSTKNRIVDDDEILVKGFKALKKAKAKAEAAERLEAAIASGADEDGARPGRWSAGTMAGKVRRTSTVALEGEGTEELRLLALEAGTSKITLKDLNLVCSQPPCAQMSGFIAIHPAAATKLHAQIKVDVALLTKHKLMDYSLLLGVHHLDGKVRYSFLFALLFCLLIYSFVCSLLLLLHSIPRLGRWRRRTLRTRARRRRTREAAAAAAAAKRKRRV